MSAPTCYFCQTALTGDTCPQCHQPQVLRGVYRLTRLIAQGGFGTVYHATDVRFKRDYAIKMIYAPSAAEQRQIQTEATLLAELAGRLTCVPDIYDAWSEGSRTIMVMEYVPGLTLAEQVEQQGPLSAIDAETLLHTLLEHLHALHSASVIHRDIKPENIKLRPDGTVVLLDFGIAKSTSATLTAAKALSPHFSAPEQVCGQPTDARSDLYSLGATIAYAVTGQLPLPSLLRLQAPARLDFQPAPIWLARALDQLMALKPEQRPASAQAALQLLATKSTPPGRSKTQPLPSQAPAHSASRSGTQPLPSRAPAHSISRSGTQRRHTLPSRFHYTQAEEADKRRRSNVQTIQALVLIAILVIACAFQQDDSRQPSVNQSLPQPIFISEDSLGPEIYNLPPAVLDEVMRNGATDLTWKELDAHIRYNILRQETAAADSELDIALTLINPANGEQYDSYLITVNQLATMPALTRVLPDAAHKHFRVIFLTSKEFLPQLGIDPDPDMPPDAAVYVEIVR